MAFVFKSEKILGMENSPLTELGPGQYMPQGLDRKLKPIKIPFFSSTFRDTQIKKDNIPGPGSYEYDEKYEKFADIVLDKNQKSPTFMKSLEVANNDNLDPFTIIISKENSKDIGFLTKERRFKESMSPNDNPGPGKYQKHEPLLLVKNSIKHKKKIPKIPEKTKLTLLRYEKSHGSPNRITTIPSKYFSYGYDIIENGEILMKEDPEKSLKYKGEFHDSVGPGSYETIHWKNWFKNMVSWDKLSKTSREVLPKKDIIQSNEIDNLDDKNNKNINDNEKNNNHKLELNKSFGNLASSINNLNNSINNKGNLISSKNDVLIMKEVKKQEKDKIYKHIREKRQKLLDIKVLKNGVDDELLKKHVMQQEPGPGYYNTELVTTAFKKPKLPEKFQTFGSSSMRFQDNQAFEVGPGSYFNDDHRLEKIKLKQYLNDKVNFSTNSMQIREDLKKQRSSNYEQRMGINGLINKDKLRSTTESPGPGWYDTIGSFKKKTTSNCGQFGSIQKRFVESNYLMTSETPGPGSYLGLPKTQHNTINGTLHKLLVKSKKPLTDDEKSGVDLTLFPKNYNENIKSNKKTERNNVPSVGTYNSDILLSLGYKVAKNVNRFNSVNAPFNSVEKRFLNFTKKTAADSIGPGQYYKDNNHLRSTVSHSPPFNTSADRSAAHNTTNLYSTINLGPGAYNVSSYFDWNKKSYNIQFI